MRSDERAQSIQIGAVLLFAALILALAGYQAFVVPQQNEQVEFSHSQTVQNQLTDLRNALVSVPGDSSSRAVSVELGTRYPGRVFAVNPGPPTGSLRTEGTSDPSTEILVENARSTGETGDFWTGEAGGEPPKSYPTGWLTYRPNYNVYDGAPTTVYENTVLFNDFSSGQVPLAGQSFVDGNRITLVALDGSLDATRSGTVSADVQPVSTSSTTVAVTDAGGPVTLRMPTRLSEARWQEILAEQMTGPDGYVQSATVPTGTNTLVVELQRGVTYDLQLAKVGVGSDVSSTGAAYLTDVSGDGVTLSEDESRRLVVEVRDEYNNPVSGVTVTAEADGGEVEDPDDSDASVTTGTDGRATFRYTANSDAGGSDYGVRFSFDDPSQPDFQRSDPADVGMTVSVRDAQSAPNDPADSDGSYTLDWRSPTASEEGSVLSNCDSDDCTWDVAASGDNELDLSAFTTPAIEGAGIDFAVNNSTVGTLTPGSSETDSSGEVSTTLTARTNGTVGLYALGPSGRGDLLNLTVENVPSEPSIALRVDDFTNRNDNEPNLVASYFVSNPGPSFERVEVSFTTANGPSGTRQSTDPRGSVNYQPGNGQNMEFDVTAEVIATNDQGGEYVADSVTITDRADARNPTGQNADLSGPGTASIDSRSVVDETNVNGNSVRYAFDYAVTSTGSYSKVRVFALNLNRNGATGTVDRTARSATDVRVRPGFGASTQYRVGIAVYDADDAIVQVLDVTEAADGNGSVTLTATTLLLAALGVTGIRRKYGS